MAYTKNELLESVDKLFNAEIISFAEYKRMNRKINTSKNNTNIKVS